MAAADSVIQDIKRTLQSALVWPTFSYAELSRALAGPFNDDYNQFHSLYQCHGNPLGRVYVNTPWPAMCFDVDSQVVYLKQDLKIDNKGWAQASPVVPPGNDPVFDTLTHYWSMDEASGTRSDSKGSLNFSESGGSIASASGKDGSCADLTANGTHELITSASRLTSVFSIAFWVKVHDGLLAAPRQWFSFGGGNGQLGMDFGNAPPYPFEIYYLFQGGGNATDNLNTLDVWHFVVVVQDNSLGDLQMSIDGGSLAQLSGSGNFSQDSDTAYLLGDGVASLGVSFDEVMIFSTALNNTDVTTLWNGGAGKFYRP